MYTNKIFKTVPPTHTLNRTESNLKPIDFFEPILPKFFKLQQKLSHICSTALPDYIIPLCQDEFTNDFTSQVREKLTEPERTILLKYIDYFHLTNIFIHFTLINRRNMFCITV